MSSVTFTITVTIDEEDELAFKHEFRALATKHMALAPPEGFFGGMDDKEKNEIIEKRLKEKEQQEKQIVLADKSDDPDFDDLNLKCWRRFGLPRNLVGETFKDNPDDSDRMQKIIGYQPNNEATPVITVDDTGIKNKWSIQQICTYFGFSRGLVIEEMSSSEDSFEEATKLKKQSKDESDEDSSSSCIEITTSTSGTTVIKNPKVSNTPSEPTTSIKSNISSTSTKTTSSAQTKPSIFSSTNTQSKPSVFSSTTTHNLSSNNTVKKAAPQAQRASTKSSSVSISSLSKGPANPIKAPVGPKLPNTTVTKMVNKTAPRKLPQIYKDLDLDLSSESPKSYKTIPQLSRIIPSNMPHLPKELETMTDTELSKYYGFEKNMIGTTFNFPTPKKGTQRLYDILGFDIRKAKYPVVAISQSTKKPQNFSVEEVLLYLENPITKK